MIQDKYRKTITKEEIMELPLTKFEGEIVVIDSFKKLKSAVQELKKTKVLGFDTESRPSFQKGKTYQVSLLQLATGDKAYLFRLNKIGLPKSLAAILADENIVKTGVAIKDDIRVLQKLTNYKPASFVELQTYVKQFEIENISLKSIAAIVLGIRISKAQQLSNWEKQRLSTSQQNYAATDAWVGFEVLMELMSN